MSVIAVYCLSNGSLLVQEGVSHDAVLFDQQFKELKRLLGTPMFPTWIPVEASITSQRRSIMIEEDRYVTWLNGLYSSALIDLSTFQSYDMDRLWMVGDSQGPAMSVVAACSSDLADYVGIGNFDNRSTLHVSITDHQGRKTNAAKSCEELTGSSSPR